MQRRVPVIALTGHLGAGKTTLLNHLLLRPGSRIGVVVNDFGEVNVDAGLITGQVDSVHSIAGGCLCHLDDIGDFDEVLEKLSHPRLDLDAIVVEASGIAEPGMLARMIRYSGAEQVRPGGLVDVVDAVNYFDTLDRGGAPPERFGVATLVVLNKCDQLDPGEREAVLDRIEGRVREINPSAYVVRTSRGQVDPELLFDVARTEEPEDELPIAALLRAERSVGEEHDHDHHHVRSVSMESEGSVSPDALVDLLESPPAGAYRMKGTVSVDLGRSTRGYVVHVVGRLRYAARSREVPARNRMVAIGAELDTTAAEEGLARVLAPSGRAELRALQRLERICRLSE